MRKATGTVAAAIGIEPARAGGDDEFRHHHVRGEARLGEGHHGIADAEGLDALSGGGDPAGDFEAEARPGEAVL